jgi:hypothetical protein
MPQSTPEGAIDMAREFFRKVELNQLYKKGCQGKKIGLDRTQDFFLRSSPLPIWFAGAVLPFSFSSVFLLRAARHRVAESGKPEVVEWVSTMVLSEAHGL